ncbi:unnamed protein product [Cylicocyclus nassatus]|uniref:Peptidase M13 N-terminal domain-containing protein n=1 Tax=Cylicocyclus nassatus TaxID=53992 RepID=A0AA36GZN2_CYLNA|nr:unnamed protein product [Cylicocyclus nassatus]
MIKETVKSLFEHNRKSSEAEDSTYNYIEDKTLPLNKTGHTESRATRGSGSYDHIEERISEPKNAGGPDAQKSSLSALLKTGSQRSTLFVQQLLIQITLLLMLCVNIALIVVVSVHMPRKIDGEEPNNDNPLNLQSPKQIENGASKYEGYKDVVKLFKSIIDTKANPCEDFYQYTCGNLQGDMSFVNSDYDNFHNMIEQFKNRSYIDKAPEPVKMMSRYFEKCVAARTNWNELTKDAKVVMAAIKRLAGGNGDYPDTKYPFYMLYQNTQESEALTPNGLAFLLGNTIGMDGVASLVQAMVDINWKDHNGGDGNKFFLDQPDTLIPYKYHIRAWDTAKQSIMETLKSIMNRIANSQGITLIEDKLNFYLNEVLEFDHVLATKYSTDDTTRRSFERSFNTMTLQELQERYDKINWKLFISEVR